MSGRDAATGPLRLRVPRYDLDLRIDLPPDLAPRTVEALAGALPAVEPVIPEYGVGGRVELFPDLAPHSCAQVLAHRPVETALMRHAGWPSPPWSACQCGRAPGWWRRSARRPSVSTPRWCRRLAGSRKAASWSR